MVLKFTENYYPNGFDPVADCPACDDIGSRDCVKKLQSQLDKTSKQYMWHRVQAQRPSTFNGQLDSFKSTTHSTAIQASPIFHSVLNFCPTGSNFMAEKWREDRHSVTTKNLRRKRSIDEEFTAGDLYKDYLWQTTDKTLSINHGMATFNEMKVPTRLPGLANKQDVPKGHKGQKCMWCDMTNSRIDLMRAPYSEQPESQVYKDGASQAADVSNAIAWPSGSSMPKQFTLIEYTIDAEKICKDGGSECTEVSNAIKWLHEL